MPTETYSNPLAPADLKPVEEAAEVPDQRHPLTNDDFRKLLMTPRPATVSSSGKILQPTVRSFSHRASHFDLEEKRKHGEKKKKAHFYVKRENEDELLEILKKYRDRARERRDGELKEYQHELELITATGGYRAVAPDIKACLDAAERRKQMIEESKYLGGDIEHTHLVKGLDYALLQKVRSEIAAKQKEDVEVEKVYQARKSEREEVESEVKSSLAKNIYTILFKTEVPKVNELFAPRRMAYVVDLDDDNVETDIPTTLIRSKQECPVDEASTNLSINDMVIQKLTQVLAYLRTDSKRKKKGKEKTEEDGRHHVNKADPAAASQHIYDDVGEYIPTLVSSAVKKPKSEGSYFRKRESSPVETVKVPSVNVRQFSTKLSEKPESTNRSSTSRKDQEKVIKTEDDQSSGSKNMREFQSKNANESVNVQHGLKLEIGNGPESYAECYPGELEFYDAAGDSDEEVDYSKMDLGNKKGPVKRWDFDTEQEYEDYMSNREALPKAAFQYGVKMNDGRRTRKVPGAKTERDEKAKLDRQWQKISRIISKRKEMDLGEESSKKARF